MLPLLKEYAFGICESYHGYTQQGKNPQWIEAGTLRIALGCYNLREARTNSHLLVVSTLLRLDPAHSPGREWAPVQPVQLCSRVAKAVSESTCFFPGVGEQFPPFPTETKTMPCSVGWEGSNAK